MRLFLGLGLLLASCSSLDQACTTEFAMITLTIVDDTGAPQPGVELRVTRVATGEDLTPVQQLEPEGVYIVVDDGSNDILAARGERLELSGTKDTRRVAAAFRVAGGECHIQKLEGPERAVLR